MILTQVKRIMIFVHYLTLAFLLNQSVMAVETQKDVQKSKELAIIETSLGTIKIELFRNKSPLTVENFIQYANSNYYNDTIFHRVIPDFMVQAGGFDLKFTKKPTSAPVKNEAKAFVPNRRGTVAMARTSDPDSATSQFFINVKNNAFLNKTKNNAGYTVFGKVVEGMEVADRISRVKTKNRDHMSDVPEENIIIKSIRISSQPIAVVSPQK